MCCLFPPTLTSATYLIASGKYFNTPVNTGCPFLICALFILIILLCLLMPHCNHTSYCKYAFHC
uniref:Uncharacterized protein n=1 Tax=uncultured marine virus TaxID=186617 RepID=A0A0F7L8S2_9VIRU|nr:hypothetical protein [uncultured marine virus]